MMMGWLRRMAAVIIFVASIIFLVAVYKGSALALQQFLDINYRVAAILIFVVVTAYTLAGGFRSVVLTDAVQGLFMAVGAVVLLVAGSSVGRDVLILGDDDPRAINRTRLWAVVTSLVSMLAALNPFGDIVSITAFSGSIYAACFFRLSLSACTGNALPLPHRSPALLPVRSRLLFGT